VYETFTIPKLYTKLEYCISCAIHAHVVRVRNAEDRRNRAPPERRRPTGPRKDDDKAKGGKKGGRPARGDKEAPAPAADAAGATPAVEEETA
jgi:small subunit ribosomal protein S26e